MAALITVELKQLHFFAYHGLYAEERKTGHEFEVNLFVSYLPVSGTITGISDTVNYVELYELLKSEKIEIAVTKLHPPITGFTGTVGVKYSKEY